PSTPGAVGGAARAAVAARHATERVDRKRARLLDRLMGSTGAAYPICLAEGYTAHGGRAPDGRRAPARGGPSGLDDPPLARREPLGGVAGVDHQLGLPHHQAVVHGAVVGEDEDG